MNYYERIQRAVDYVEERLDGEIVLEEVARQAYMSLANLYRLFFAMTGRTVKDYIRHRRLSMAARDIREGGRTLLDIALTYGYDSHEAFTRAFKKAVGIPPGAYKKHPLCFEFGRVNVVDRYIDIQDPKLLEKYPEIKVLKELQPMRVASFHYFGTEPENGSWKKAEAWLRKVGLDKDREGVRVFGFNNPSPGPGDKEYGFEYWITLPEHFEPVPGSEADSLVEGAGVKIFPGGLYAVMSVTGGGEALPAAWHRLGSWLRESKYTYGGHQWLEEHLDMDENLNFSGHFDIYIPIAPKEDHLSTQDYAQVAPMQAISYRASGKRAAEEAKGVLLPWAEQAGLLGKPEEHRVFAYYNHERMGQKDFWFEICVSVGDETDAMALDPRLTMKQFPGGTYAVRPTVYKRAGWAWGEFIRWVSSNEDYGYAEHQQFFEEYQLSAPVVEEETPMKLYMPVFKKGESVNP